jgi:hypothetical protein
VTVLNRCISLSPLGSEFDNFLFAKVGEDENGMSLSVATALTRLNMDPWQEAEALARLPREAAMQRLNNLIGPLTKDVATSGDTGKIVVRLVTLLERPASRLPAALQSTVIKSAQNTRYLVFVLIVIATFMLVMSARVFIPNIGPQMTTEDASGRR